MGRPKGFKPSPEQIKAMQEGRKAARDRKIAAGEPIRSSKKRKNRGVPEVNKEGKPIITVTGKEKECFDFYTPIRDAFRSLNRHNEVDKILKDITNNTYWQNITWIQNTLSKYVVLVM